MKFLQPIYNQNLLWNTHRKCLNRENAKYTLCMANEATLNLRDPAQGRKSGKCTKVNEQTVKSRWGLYSDLEMKNNSKNKKQKTANRNNFFGGRGFAILQTQQTRGTLANKRSWCWIYYSQAKKSIKHWRFLFRQEINLTKEMAKQVFRGWAAKLPQPCPRRFTSKRKILTGVQTHSFTFRSFKTILPG